MILIVYNIVNNNKYYSYKIAENELNVNYYFNLG